MSVITYGFPLCRWEPCFGSVFPHWWPFFFFSGINYTTESISGNRSIRIPGGHHATPIDKGISPLLALETNISCLVNAPGVVCPSARSGKDTPTNGINNFISGIIGYLRRNLGYNSISNADIQGFCSWIAWGRDGFLHGIPCPVSRG